MDWGGAAGGRPFIGVASPPRAPRSYATVADDFGGGEGDYESDLQAYLGCRPTHCKELDNLVIN